MTDPKQDVRQQFEAWAVREDFSATRNNPLGQYDAFSVESRWDVWQAALQSPAVRGLVEAMQGVIAVADRKTDEFDRAKAALRTLGADHVE